MKHNIQVITLLLNIYVSGEIPEPLEMRHVALLGSYIVQTRWDRTPEHPY